jgi:hypothetical protein
VINDTTVSEIQFEEQSYQVSEGSSESVCILLEDGVSVDRLLILTYSLTSSLFSAGERYHCQGV